MIDKFNRKINYLRVSVTDRCNLRCVYCMPEQGIIHKQPADILSFEQIYKIVKVAAGLGIDKVRITGGEPLVRKDLPLLIRKLKEICGLKEAIPLFKKTKGLIMESNSALKHLKPDLALFIKNKNSILKPSAREIINKIDLVVTL